MNKLDLEKFDPKAIAGVMQSNWVAIIERLSGALLQSDKLLEDGEISKYEHRKLLHEINKQREDLSRMSVDQVLHYYSVKFYHDSVSGKSSDIERTERSIASNLAIAEATKEVNETLKGITDVLKRGKQEEK